MAHVGSCVSLVWQALVLSGWRDSALVSGALARGSCGECGRCYSQAEQVRLKRLSELVITDDRVVRL